jgi:hypothetical protein
VTASGYASILLCGCGLFGGSPLTISVGRAGFDGLSFYKIRLDPASGFEINGLRYIIACLSGRGVFPPPDVVPNSSLDLKPTILDPRLRWVDVFSFFKKGSKKLNSKKGCRFRKFRKMGTSRPTNGREHGAGDLPPIQRAGGSKSFSRSLPWWQRHPARPTGGRSFASRCSCARHL